MENVREIFASGSELDAALAVTDTKFKQNRVPHVGQKMQYRDGRKFVFCGSSVDIAAAQMVGFNQPVGIELANAVVATTPVGSFTVEINTKTYQFFGGAAGVLAANALADGYIIVTDDAGEGYIYKIKSHTAGTAAANITFTLYDALTVALTTASDVCFASSSFADVVVCTATTKPIGSCMVAVTAGTATVKQYFWVQYSGPGVALSTAGVTTGLPVAAGVAGVVADNAASATNVVGVAMATVANGQAPIWLDCM